MPNPLHILAIGFLSPLLMAAGAAATSIPIVIHLLNKRKFKIVIWAAMEWLLAAQRRNARRMKFQRWLLLALRCLALLLIAAGVAQLVLQNTALGTLLGEQRAVIILWDDSYSMGYQQEVGGIAPTAFDKSKRLLDSYINSLKAGDNVLVIRASTGAVTTANEKPSPDRTAAIARIHAAALTDGATDLPAAFDRAAQILQDLESTTRARQLILITDFTNSSIHDPKRGTGVDNLIEGADGQRLKKAAQTAIARTTGGKDFRLIDVGAEAQTNTAIARLTSRRPAVVATVPTELQVEVFNASERPLIDLPVSLLLDGVPMQTVKLGKIEPGTAQTGTATVIIPTAGRHLVEARLANSDLLALDDTRRLMLNVRKEIPVLLVDGSPGDGGRTSSGSTVYLQAAYGLAIDGKFSSFFAPKTITELEFATTPLAGFDAIVLSDTAAPGPAMRETLQKFVQDGGLLMIFPGSRTNPQALSETLGDNGAKLLPASIGQPAKAQGDGAQGWTFAGEGFQRNPVMQVFADAYKAGKEVGLLTVQTSQYFTLGVPADGSSEVILHYAKKDGAAGDAAVVMRRNVGADPAKNLPGGTVILFASSADMTLSTWGGKPSFLPFIHELTFYGMSRNTIGTGAGLTLNVGQSLALPPDFAAPGNWNGPRDSHFFLTQEISDGHASLTGPPLMFSGTYAPANGDQRPVVAVNPDSREADIRHVTGPQMTAALGVDVNTITAPNDLINVRQAADTAGGSTFGPLLLGCALIVFLIEAILALAFSTYR
jgi:hypothetical protein